MDCGSGAVHVRRLPRACVMPVREREREYRSRLDTITTGHVELFE
jgi:hypothetical protein